MKIRFVSWQYLLLPALEAKREMGYEDRYIFARARAHRLCGAPVHFTRLRVAMAHIRL